MSTVTKTNFKAHALEHLRNVQATKRPLVILERGRPVLKVVPYTDDFEKELAKFKGLLIHYDNPLAPIEVENWELV